MQLVLGLPGYIIGDGELDDLEIGSTFTYPLGLFFRGSPRVTCEPPTRVRLYGSDYYVVGRIVAARGGVLVIDLGDLLVYVNNLQVPTREPGACLSGAGYLGLDIEHGIKPFEASEMAEAVKYSWRVLGIELDVTPWINPKTYWERDESRFETRPVASTRLPAASAGRGNDFYCLCERVDAETEKGRGAR
jgi:hypothetical protein